MGRERLLAPNSKKWRSIKTSNKKKHKVSKDKEFLYVGHYIDKDGNYILKIGTTNNLNRRKKEHTQSYAIATQYTMAKNGEFVYDWSLPLSKYNTLRYENKNRELWQKMEVGEFVRNDRFCCKQKPKQVEVTIRKTYVIEL